MIQLLAISGGPRFDGFSGPSLLALVAAIVALGVWFLLFAYRWARTFPRLPDAGPETSELRDEPPAIVNLLVNRWKVTQSAISATLVDLAARRVVGIDLVGGDEYVVRIRDGDHTTEELTDYERQVLDLVKSRATGGSCPAQALDLGEEGEADGWVKRFKKRVVSDAKDRGLARNRWALHDFTIIGVGLAIALGLFASAFALSHLLEGTGGDSSGSDKWSQSDWLWAAVVAWMAAMFAVSRTQAIRDTAKGRAACAHWLGVRDYFRHNHAFDNAQAAAVVLWERNLSYGVALGAAHEAAHDIPLAPDDPDEAWTRYGGMWRQVRVEYPSRFGYGESPGHVLLGGVGRILLWGGLCFVALPILLNLALDVADSVTSSDTSNLGSYYLPIVLGVAAFATGAALYLFIRFMAGVIRAWRALNDLTKVATLEGQVVKVHMGRAAVDDGKQEELAAFAPGAIHATRGDVVRVTMTPHLHYVKNVEVLTAAPKFADELAEEAVRSSATPSPVLATRLSGIEEAIRAAAGPAFIRGRQGSGPDLGPLAAAGPIQAFSDGNGSTIAVAAIGAGSGPMAALVNLMSKRLGASGQPVEGTDGKAVWMRDTDLLIRGDDGITMVHCDLKDRSPQDRLLLAQSIAAHLDPVASEPVPPSPAQPGEEMPVS